MKMTMVSVRDSVADVFGRPWFAQNEGAAIRVFSDEVNRNEQENSLANHPSDYALYRIGDFDDAEGKVYPTEVPQLLIQASNVKNVKG